MQNAQHCCEVYFTRTTLGGGVRPESIPYSLLYIVKIFCCLQGDLVLTLYILHCIADTSSKWVLIHQILRNSKQLSNFWEVLPIMWSSYAVSQPQEVSMWSTYQGCQPQEFLPRFRTVYSAATGSHLLRTAEPFCTCVGYETIDIFRESRLQSKLWFKQFTDCRNISQ
jgi:hypothetical protein